MYGNRNRDPGHWLLRGIQSACFYYLSCTPYHNWRYTQRRHREARVAEDEIVDTEPGFERQPMAFRTNEEWAEEILMGPGPPKRWKPDPLLIKIRKGQLATPPPTPTSESSTTMGKLTRPKFERRVSNALYDVKESIRNSLHPEKWNWKRYDRDDEILWGLGDKMVNVGGKVTRMWERVTSGSQADEGRTGRKRAYTNESDNYDYSRGTNPAINDLHPPVVSQLPATREEAAWMLLPPPPAAVMEGKERPMPDMAYRIPMCRVGAPLKAVKSPEKAVLKEERFVSHSTWDTMYCGGDTDSEETVQPRHKSEPLPLAVRPQPITSESTDPYRPKTRKITRLDGIPMDLFTKTELSSSGTESPKSRPTSWQFSYIIPSQ